MPNESLPPQFFEFTEQRFSVSPEIWEAKSAELRAKEAEFYERMYAVMKERLADAASLPPVTVEAGQSDPTIRDALRTGRGEVQKMIDDLEKSKSD